MNSIFSAAMTPQFVPVYYANEECGGTITVSPQSTMNGFYDSGTVLTFTETPASGWTFTEWENDLTGVTNPQNLTLDNEVLVTADYNTTSAPLTLATISPASVTAGARGFTLALIGTGFTSGSNVYVNNIFRASTFISSTEITVPILASDLSAAGAFQVGVQNYPTGALCAAFAPRALYVLLASTTTTVTSSLNPSTYGKGFSITAAVVPGTSGKPTGTVSFTAGSAALGSALVNTHGQAKLNVAATKLKAGTYAIVGAYSGDSTYLPSTSAALSQVVNKAATTAGLTSAPNPSTQGQPVTFTATISPQFTGLPTGNVTFKDGHMNLGQGRLGGNHQAMFTTSSLSQGTHSITAVYAGDTNFTGSTSSILMQVVN